MNFFFNLVVNLVPVSAFLVVLVFLDSYKLAPLRLVLLTLLAGMLAAGLSFFANTGLTPVLNLSTLQYSRYISPVIEESLKAGTVFLLIRTRRVGFLVDAAIYGLAVGAGFALVENTFHLLQQDHQSLALATVRGFGTAIMHGGVTVIAAVMAKLRVDRDETGLTAAFAIPLLTAICIHSLFNHFILPPAWTMFIIITLLPVLVYVTFKRSEQSVQLWLGSGMDRDFELFEAINADDFPDSRIGQYLRSLREHFSSDVVVDIYCLLRTYVELSLNVKGVMLLRQSGFRPALDDATRSQLTELMHLEASVGPTGRLTLKPILRSSGRELWQLYQLSK